MKIKLSIIATLSLVSIVSFGQCDPTPQFCNGADCGQVEIGLESNGNNEFCQGEEVEILIDEMASSDFDILIYYWCDGVVDTLDFSDQPGTHTYDIPEDEICNTDITGYFVQIIGIKYCGDEFSCITAGVSLSILHEPRAIFDGPSTACVGNEIAFNATSCNAEEYLWDFGDGITSTEPNPTISYSNTGSKNVTLTVTNQCGTHTASQTVNVLGVPEANVILSGNAEDCVICLGEEVTFTDDSNIWATSTIWSITPSGSSNWEFTDTSMNSNSKVISVDFKKAGNYSIKLTADNDCNGDDVWEKEIEVLDGPTVDLADVPRFCQNGIYMPFASYTGTIDSYLWTFEGGNPSTSIDPNPPDVEYLVPGVYPVTIAVDGACGLLIDTDTIIVDELVEVSITPAGPYCQGSSPDTLMANVTGGDWSGPGIIDEDLGIFDPSLVGPGDYPITYTYGSGVCEDADMISVIVNPSETVTTPNVTVCAYEETVLLSAEPTGGDWSGTFVDINGVFDVQAAGVGEFDDNTYLYIDANGCNIMSMASVDVEMIPTIEMLDTTFLCVGGGQVDLQSVTQSGSNVSGGDYTFFINGTMASNPYTIGNTEQEDVLIVQYEIGSCTVYDTAVIALITPPNLTLSPLDTTLCISAGTFTFESTINGGSWSGPGINSITGEVDLESIGGGTFNYQYTIFPNSSCETIGNTMLEVIDPGAELDQISNVEFCEDEFSTYFLGDATPEGIYWTGPEVVDSLTGEVNLSTLNVGEPYTYNYCLDFAAFDDCEACKSITLTINPLPVINYTLVGGACIGESFTISDSTLFGEDYLWDFGDGNTSTEKEPSHSYSVSGFYDIVLTVTSDKGCPSTDSREVYVSRPPIVDFDLLSDEGCAPFLVELENNSSGDNISFQWIIAGDTLTDLVPQNIIIDGISTDTIFDIILNVTNSCGTVTQIEEVLVHPYPIVDIGVSVDEGCSPVTIDFGNLTVGNPDDFCWDLGNGVESKDSIPPAQTYTTSDSLVSMYEVTLISSNECGVDTGYQTITVYPPDVEAFIAIDTTVLCQYDSFDVRSFSTPGSELTWSVFDSDGNQVGGYEGEETTIILSDSGMFTIVLFASRCGTDTDTAYVTVLPAPDLDFMIPPFVCQGDSLQIQNNSPMLSATSWDFGDGNTSTDFSPFHIYDTTGMVQISLTGFSSINNCPFTLTKEIEIIGKPTASFAPSTLDGCRPLTIDFENNSIGATDFNWYWNDGTSSSLDENPSHTFIDSGTFLIELVVFDEYGCFGDTAISNIIVHDLPVSSFTTDQDTYCQFYDSIVVTNNSIDDIIYNWQINDISDDRESPVLYTEENGPQTIVLIVENMHGCMDTSEQIVTILPSPVADAIPNDTIDCQPFQLFIDNQSIQSDSYIWNINNEESSSDANLDFLLTESGTYDIELIAINNNGCPNDTSLISIIVKEKPTAEFTALKDSLCGVPMNVQFTNLSISNIIDNNWTFGNGEDSQLSDPSVIFNNDEDYVVSLIVENDQNCLDTTEQIVEVWHQPIADISLNERIFCEGDTIFINNNSQHVNSYTWVIGGSDSITTFLPEFVVSEMGQYDIELIVAYNDECKDTTALSGGIDVYNTPIAGFDHIADMDENIIGDVEFINQSEEYERLEWNLGDGNFSNEEDFVHEYDINRGIEVTLYAIDDNDGKITCIDSISKTIEPEWITTFFAPNALSPSYGSEEIRVFTPKGIGLKKYEINVYSPWGKRVWQSTDLDEGQPTESWNGLINNTGPEVAQGAYTWIAEIEFVDGRVGVYKGSVTVLR